MVLVNLSLGVVPVLEQLLEQSSTTKYAYLCHGCVHHVSKLKKEGKLDNPPADPSKIL
jgi:hypothetical protein